MSSEIDNLRNRMEGRMDDCFKQIGVCKAEARKSDDHRRNEINDLENKTIEMETKMEHIGDTLKKIEESLRTQGKRTIWWVASVVGLLLSLYKLVPYLAGVSG
jgi:hypothetical protein